MNLIYSTDHALKIKEKKNYKFDTHSSLEMVFKFMYESEISLFGRKFFKVIIIAEFKENKNLK